MKRIISRFFSKQQVGYAFMGRSTGGFSERYTDEITASTNLARLRNAFDAPYSTLMLVQGGAKIRIAHKQDKTITGDSLITKERLHNLLIRPADCIPLVLFSKTSPLLALIHCSRNGLDENIVQKTIVKVLEMSGKQPNDFAAYIGPGIGKESYILPKVTIDRLKHESWNDFIHKTHNGFSVDLKGFIKAELRKAGLQTTDISVSSIDTAANSAYYSHYRSTRRHDPEGRNGFVVCIL